MQMSRKIAYTRIFAAAAIIVGVAVVAGILLFRQTAPAGSVQIHMTSDPFPMSIGNTTLLVTLTNADGARMDEAAVEVSAEMMHMGMLPLTRQTSHSLNGEYRVPIIWPMAGQWMVDVTVHLQNTTMNDQFQVYVYPVPPKNQSNQSVFRSSSENKANSPQELLLVIPQGAQALIMAGQADELVPAEINLNVSGQNTLVIRNDDIVDHTVGPFFVKAGEVVRQEFTKPAVYIGSCSISYTAEVSIIVED
jgi:hypothetical protein